MIKVLDKHPNGLSFPSDAAGQPRITFSYLSGKRYHVYCLYGDGTTRDEPGSPIGRRFTPRKGATEVKDKNGVDMTSRDAPAVLALIKALRGETRKNPVAEKGRFLSNMSESDRASLVDFLHKSYAALGGKALSNGSGINHGHQRATSPADTGRVL